MKIKKIFSLLLAFCLAVRLIPIAAFAADYNVTINGIAITDSNANDVLGDGTVSYDADTNTLMLNGANLTQIQNTTGKAFTIKVSGNNTVAITSGTTNLIETNAPLMINGDARATLILSGADQNSYISCISAHGSVTVEIITLILTNSCYAGIETTGDITVRNSATVKGDTGNMFYATSVGAGKLTVSDSTVTAPLEGTSVSGWMSAWVNEMEFSNSIVDIVAANGIYASDNIVIKNKSDVRVTADGIATPYPGIFAGNSMSITDSKVEGVSYTYAGLHAAKDLIITDSSIKAVTTSTDYPALNAKGELKISGLVTIDTEAASGVSYNGNVIFEVRTPAQPTDIMYKVHAGANATGAAEIKDSPFAADTDITKLVQDSPYFTIVSHIHSGGTPTCKSGAICDDCNNEYGDTDPANHTNLIKIEAKAATHTVEGNIEYWYCNGCGKYFSDEAGTKKITPADTVTAKLTAHTFDKEISDKKYLVAAATCQQPAKYYKSCECGESSKGTESEAIFRIGGVSSVNHINLVRTDAKDATHLTEGNIEYWYCNSCEHYFSDEAGTKEITLADTVTAKLTAHTFNKEIQDQEYLSAAATCRQPAKYYKSCECGKSSKGTENEAIFRIGDVSPANHTNLVRTNAKDATHLTEGNIKYWYCNSCENYFSDEAGTKEITLADTVTAKLTAHTFNKEIQDTEYLSAAATCQQPAKYYKSCECGQSSKGTENEAIFQIGGVSPVNHINLVKKEAKGATHLTEGNIEYWYCNSCEHYFSDETGTKEITLADTIIEKITQTTEPTKPNQNMDGKYPQTGDMSNLMLWLLLLPASAAGAGGTLLYSHKRKKSTH